MADEATITPDAEVKATEVVEGSVEAQLTVDTPVEKKVDTVPLSVYLELKEDLKSLKHEMKESKGANQAKVEAQGVKELARKYPDVNEDFINDMLSSATQEATKKIEEKYSPIIERQDMEKKKIAFDVAFDKLFDKTMTNNPELPRTIDKELVKELASTPKYRNTSLSEILTKMYGGEVKGKSSSENDTRSAPDRIDDTVDFQKVTAEQRKAILSDPKAKAKYYAYLDTLG
jgi:hypothetical protein